MCIFAKIKDLQLNLQSNPVDHRGRRTVGDRRTRRGSIIGIGGEVSGFQTGRIVKPNFQTQGRTMRRRTFLKAGAGTLATSLLIGNPNSSTLFAASPASTAAALGQSYPSQQPLTAHPAADWFRDAKFGIYFHWGPYCVPAYDNEWYSRNMYVKGSAAYKYHVATYGGPEKFGYKDFIPQFTAQKFDADEWADLFKRSGARFAGPVAEHADGWSNWDSKLTRWNAAKMGPRKDITGLMAAAVRKRNMKFIATFHHQWLWGWYPTMDKTVDCSNPEYAGLYGPAVPPSAFTRNRPAPSPEFCELWLAKVEEVVDKYQPDLIWFDSRLSIIGDRYRQEMLAYYYGKEPSWGRSVVVTCKNGDFPAGASVPDLERGRMEKLADVPWLTDTAICNRSWCHIQNPDYKSAKTLVHTLSISSARMAACSWTFAQPLRRNPPATAGTLAGDGQMAEGQRRGDLRNTALEGFRRRPHARQRGPFPRGCSLAVHRRRHPLYDQGRRALCYRARAPPNTPVPSSRCRFRPAKFSPVRLLGFRQTPLEADRRGADGYTAGKYGF